MFKVNRSMVPSYITSLFSDSNNRTIRCILPNPRIDLYKTSLAFSGPSVWNTLPAAIKTIGLSNVLRVNCRHIPYKPSYFTSYSSCSCTSSRNSGRRTLLSPCCIWCLYMCRYMFIYMYESACVRPASTSVSV